MEREICKVCKSKSLAAKQLRACELDLLGDNCAQVVFKTGDIIIKQNSLSTNVAYIKSGLVKLHMQGPIKEMILRIVKAPTYLCLPSTFGDKVNHFSATALEETTVCFIDFQTFKKLIYENGDFAFQILLDLSQSQLQNFKNCINNAQKHSLGRIADVLLYFSKVVFEDISFNLPISRQELGDMAGTTRESASRILSGFHNDKIIQLEGKKIVILNQNLLEQISEKG
jgi:CRP/FNR family transcriptional regulator